MKPGMTPIEMEDMQNAEEAERLSQIPQSPTGYAPGSGLRKPSGEASDADIGIESPDRWTIGFPEDPRLERNKSFLNPYRTNVLKGDTPVMGNYIFMVLLGESETLNLTRRVPVPQGVLASRPRADEFFGRGSQYILQQNFILSTELFRGDAGFKPADWRIKFTPVFNINYLLGKENVVNQAANRGTTRLDNHVGLQEAFGEVRLGDTPTIFPFLRGRGSRGGHSPFFDFTSLRVGIQQFNSDFRGLIFFDNNLGARLFGNFRDNKWQYNLAFFHMLEKDTNSGLNTLDKRNQRVYIANLFRQDFIKPGYTSQFSIHYNDDQPDFKQDTNRNIVRPAPIGRIMAHSVKAGYLGWTGNGHFRRLNVSHAFYQVFGRDTFNPIANRATSINAQMAFAEFSVDRDWQRYKISGFFTSGDGNPEDGTARGFDSILDNQFVLGGQNSFWNSQEIRLTRANVALVTQNSLIPSLRTSRNQGQANFVNPGIFAVNFAYDAELTPKLRLETNINYLRFHKTESLRQLLSQQLVRKNIGIDYGFGITFRPLLSENIIMKAGANFMTPLDGFKDIFTSNCAGQNCGQTSRFLYSIYSKMIFTF
jgi:hypothetical protein